MNLCLLVKILNNFGLRILIDNKVVCDKGYHRINVKTFLRQTEVNEKIQPIIYVPFWIEGVRPNVAWFQSLCSFHPAQDHELGFKIKPAGAKKYNSIRNENSNLR